MKNCTKQEEKNCFEKKGRENACDDCVVKEAALNTKQVFQLICPFLGDESKSGPADVGEVFKEE